MGDRVGDLRRTLEPLPIAKSTDRCEAKHCMKLILKITAGVVLAWFIIMGISLFLGFQILTKIPEAIDGAIAKTHRDGTYDTLVKKTARQIERTMQFAPIQPLPDQTSKATRAPQQPQWGISWANESQPLNKNPSQSQGYKPPPDCQKQSLTWEKIVECSNQWMRAQRAQ